MDSNTLYESLQINRAKMPDVWVLVEQYPPLYMGVAWHPRAKPQVDVDLLRLRYDAEGNVRSSLREIGHQQGLTAERVRLRLNRIIGYLREQLSHNGESTL